MGMSIPVNLNYDLIKIQRAHENVDSSTEFVLRFFENPASSSERRFGLLGCACILRSTFALRNENVQKRPQLQRPTCQERILQIEHVLMDPFGSTVKGFGATRRGFQVLVHHCPDCPDSDGTDASAENVGPSTGFSENRNHRGPLLRAPIPIPGSPPVRTSLPC